MKIFSSLYAKAMNWARHPKAPLFLGGLSFAESSFLPNTTRCYVGSNESLSQKRLGLMHYLQQ